MDCEDRSRIHAPLLLLGVICESLFGYSYASSLALISLQEFSRPPQSRVHATSILLFNVYDKLVGSASPLQGKNLLTLGAFGHVLLWRLFCTDGRMVYLTHTVSQHSWETEDATNFLENSWLFRLRAIRQLILTFALPGGLFMY